MAKSDLFILTSLYEGLPNVLLESIVLKKYIISSNCPTGPSEILNKGKYGELFPVKNYRNLSKKLDLDVLIHPGNITTSAILQYVRRGKVKEVHDFGNDRGEIMEIEILPTTKFADKQIIDLDMPDGVVIGGIVRNKKLIFPDENTTIYVNDKLIIFSKPSSIKEIEKYSEVNIEFF